MSAKVDQRRSSTLTTLALWWAPLAVLVLVGGAFVVGMPSYGEGGYWETVAQAVPLGVYLIAGVSARWFPMPSATVMTVMAFAIGALSGLTWPPWFGLLLALVLWMPAGLHWVVWRRGRSTQVVVALAGVLLVCIGVTVVAGQAIYDYVQGPQTPQSALERYPPSDVRWVWSTAVTPTSFTVVARLDDDQDTARLVYGLTPELTGPSTRSTDWVVRDPRTGGVRLDATGLNPASVYYYAVEVPEGVDRARTGRVRTFPDAAAPVTLAFASCQRNGSNAAVFSTIAELQPDLFLMTGDLHYSDIASDSVSDFLDAYDRQLSAGAPQAMYLATPAVYMWDDHDYGPDDADRTSPSRPAALATYRSLGAHYPLALTGDQAPVAQAFSIGTVRVIVTDLRSARDPSSAPDGPGKSTMGEEQREWFLDELTTSSRSHDVVVWVSSVPWIVGDESPGDSWGAYATERARIADAIAAHGISNLVMIAGDAHMLAADDGTNSDYSSSGGAGFPVLQAAALDRAGSTKGGPYSEGTYPGAGQFGLLRIEPAQGSGASRMRFEGRTWDGQVLVSLDATLPMNASASG